jgi:hypothetical protein
MAAGEMRRESLVRAQASEVDDALDSSIPCGSSEVQSACTLFARELVPRCHRVNEVVRSVNASEGCSEGPGIEHIAADDFDIAGKPRAHVVGPTRHAAHALTSIVKRADQAATDVAGCSSD